MQKSISSNTYAIFLEHLRDTREKLGITQEVLAERLGESQSFISKCERGERRLDVAELREFCIAMDLSLDKFIRGFEKKI
jgi:transcriptional regulator with XRE-family HTH domain